MIMDFVQLMNIISKTGATRLRACKLVSGYIKLAIAQTGDVAFPSLR